MILNFGKYKGYSLEDVAYKDPDYIFWLGRNKVINPIDESIYDLANKRDAEIAVEKRNRAIANHRYHQKRGGIEYELRGDNIDNWYDENGL